MSVSARAQLDGRTGALEQLAIEMYARGLSTRDIEATFCGPEGQTLLSRTAVSELTEKLWDEDEAFVTRDLGEHRIIYLFVDGIAERLRPGQPREAVLGAWGIDDMGRKHLLHLAPGTKEDTDSCRAFFQDMKRRGGVDPLFVNADGAPGVIRAVEECFPRAVRGRCLAHKMRNLAAKVPDDLWPEVKARAKAGYEAPSLAMAEALRDDCVRSYERDLPSAVGCFLDDLDACIAHLRFPVAHRRAIRTTNLLERLYEEERRRLKIIPNTFGERPVLKLMYATMIRASERWRALKITTFERKQLEVIQRELDDAHRRRHEPVQSAKTRKSPARISSSART